MNINMGDVGAVVAGWVVLGIGVVLTWNTVKRLYLRRLARDRRHAPDPAGDRDR